MTGTQPVDLIGTGLQTMAMFLIVLAVLAAFLFLMRRYLVQAGKHKGNHLLGVVATLNLSTKEKVVVLDASGERIVIGVAPGRISFITKLGGPEAERLESRDE